VNTVTGLVQIQTSPEAGRKDIGPARKFWIEPDLLYPLLKGAGDFSNFEVRQKEELYYLLPNVGINKDDYKNSVGRLKSLPRTARLLKHYKGHLENRSTYRTRMPGAPYHSVYNVGDYTFAPFKVVWAEQSSVFRSAVFESSAVPILGNRPFAPDHKVYFADFQDRGIAHYVCGLLNSSLVKEFVESHTIQIQVSNIFKHLSLPEFDSDNKNHRKLAQMSIKAHAATDQKIRDKALITLDKLASVILST